MKREMVSQLIPVERVQQLIYLGWAQLLTPSQPSTQPSANQRPAERGAAIR